MSIKFAASILSADFTRLGEQVEEAIAAGISYIQVDVMDGHYVPNISLGVPIVAAIKPICVKQGALLDVHLMIEKPELFIPEFVQAGADILTVHLEASLHLHRTVQRIREYGIKAGVALNPFTPLVFLEEVLPFIDIVLLMSVDPGYGGQPYLPTMTDKIESLRRILDQRGFNNIEVEVDGGIKPHNVCDIVRAGADVLVIGSGLYNSNGSVAENLADYIKAIC